MISVEKDSTSNDAEMQTTLWQTSPSAALESFNSSGLDSSHIESPHVTFPCNGSLHVESSHIDIWSNKPASDSSTSKIDQLGMSSTTETLLSTSQPLATSTQLLSSSNGSIETTQQLSKKILGDSDEVMLVEDKSRQVMSRGISSALLP